MKKVYLIGNLLLNNDNQPLLLQRKLQEKFPNVQFLSVDPNENFIPEENSIIIDSVLGIDKVIYYQSIDSLIVNNFVSPHDYDLGFHLKLLKKLKKIKSIIILGVPSSKKRQQIENEVIVQLEKIIST